MEHKTISAHSIALGILALAFLMGIAAGCLFSLQGGGAADSAVADYLSAFTQIAVTPPSLGRVLADTMLYPSLCFLLGFTIPGVLLIPLTVAFRGFLLSYTVASCIRVFGSLDGFFFSSALIGLPLLLCLPCLFFLGTRGLLNSQSLLSAVLRKAKRIPLFDKSSFLQFAFALCIMIAAAAAEWLLCPLLTGLAVTRL